MKKNHVWCSVFMTATGLFLLNLAQAGTPVWRFEQVPGFPATVNVSNGETGVVADFINLLFLNGDLKKR